MSFAQSEKSENRPEYFGMPFRKQPMSQPAKHFFEFGPFRLDPVERLLYRDGEVVTLTAKIFDILLVFVQNSGRTVEKAEMMARSGPISLSKRET
jgi:DNA-binding response OmpR family regulator